MKSKWLEFGSFFSSFELVKNFFTVQFLSPKIYTKDGHIIFKSGQKKNITFITSEEGNIFVNDYNLIQIVNSAKKAAQKIDLTTSKIIDANSESFKEQLAILSNKLNDFEDFRKTSNEQLTRLRKLFAGDTDTAPPVVKKLSRRVLSLERTLRTINRVRNIVIYSFLICGVTFMTFCTISKIIIGGKQECCGLQPPFSILVFFSH